MESLNKPLNMHKDRLSKEELDLQDPYVTSSLGFFAIHNVIRRNLLTTSQTAQSIATTDLDPFLTYANYTLHVVTDQLESVDTIWFPVFATHNPDFHSHMAAHDALKERVTALQTLLLENDLESILPTTVATGFRELYEAIDTQFDAEEASVVELGHAVPLAEIRDMEKKQEDRRKADVKTYGHLWMAAYLLRSLEPKERTVFPPGIPSIVVSGLLTAAALQFRRELRFSPRF